MKKIVLTAYGAHLPEIPAGVFKSSWLIPPAVAVDGGMQLDISPLLVVDRAILDTNTYNYLETAGRSFLAPMREAVRVLIDEGFVELEEFSDVAIEHADILAKQTDLAVADPLLWLGQMRDFVSWWHRTQSEMQAGLGDDYDENIPIIMGIYCHLIRKHGTVDQQEAARLTRLLQSPKKRWLNVEKDELRSIIRPYLSYIHLNLAISNVTGHPVMDWDGLGGFYKAKYDATLRSLSPTEERSHATVAKAQELFSVLLPQLRPKTVTQIVTLLKDRRIKDIRKFIAEAVDQGKPFTRERGEQILIAASQAQLRVEKVRRFTSWVCGASSFVPFLNYVTAPASELTNVIVSHRAQRKYKWLYALLHASEKQ